MDAIKAGVEKMKEAVDMKKAEENIEKANDPNIKPSERMDATFEARKATENAAKHGAKAEVFKAKHVH